MSAKPPRVVVIMGVSGSGKTTVGNLLAQRHDGVFFDADDYHPAVNVAKMAAGTPLTDQDRLPWLQRLRTEIIDPAPVGQLTILACSALKQTYRQLLGLERSGIATVFLEGDTQLLSHRLHSRSGHFMKPGMLTSQLETLEPPAQSDALHISIQHTPQEIVAQISEALFLG